MASFLVVMVSCVVVNSVHLLFSIDVISFFSSSNHVAFVLWASLLFQRFPQKYVISSYDGSSEISVVFY